MKAETITLSDGKVIVYVWQNKRRYVRVTKDNVTKHKKGKK